MVEVSDLILIGAEILDCARLGRKSFDVCRCWI
jgi:hypothetical protein